MERRLAAILATDVVGYSRLMGDDEEATLAKLNAYRAVIDALVADHRGRVFGSAGDSVIAEFASPVEAVRCAISIQTEIEGRDADLPEDRRMRLRIGVNLGDVMAEGDNLFGDGVNVAARLEEFAEPGDVCISAKVHDEVTGKTDGVFIDAGEHQVKNITAPIRVWRWSAAGNAGEPHRLAEALALPDKPSIAVLPFTNMSGDAEQEYFSDGITEDIITELSRFRSLFVIARNSSFAYKGQSVNVGKVGQELGVAYLVEGSVRKAGNRVRITAQLVEAESGNHLWAERYDRDLENIFDVQDEVVQEIAASVPGQLNVAAMDRARRRPAENLSAYDCLLRGEWLMFRDFTDPDVIPLFERAVEIDPKCARAYIQLARRHAYSVPAQGVSVDEAAPLARTLAERALEISPSDPSIQSIAAGTYNMMYEHDLARQHIERAISLNPNDGEVMAHAALVLTYLGDHDAGLRWNRVRSRHDPHSADGYRENTFDIYYMARRYEDAIAVFRGWRNPPIQLHAELAAAYAQNGQPEEAKAALETYLGELPEGYDIAAFFRHHLRMCAKPEDAEHWREGYRKAGLDL